VRREQAAWAEASVPPDLGALKTGISEVVAGPVRLREQLRHISLGTYPGDPVQGRGRGPHPLRR
jgi:hypothetical protein